MALATVLSLSSACMLDRTIASFSERSDGGDDGADAGATELLKEDLNWGDYTSTLGLSPCPDGGVLLVNTTDDELEGGASLMNRAGAGLKLSLREATFIAANAPASAHTILFDPLVFPVGADAGVISVVDSSLKFPLSHLANTCIDARGRGVVLRFSLGAYCETACMWSLGSGSRMTGLVITGNAPELKVVGNAQVIANRFSVRYRAVNAFSGAIIGPSNVIRGGVWAIQSSTGAPDVSPPRISGNFINIEPTNSGYGTTSTALVFFLPVIMFDNVAAHTSVSLSSSGSGRIHDNSLLRGSSIHANGTGWTIGPGNTIEGDVRLTSAGGNGNLFLQNVLTGDLSCDGMTATITSASVGNISGTCPVDGSVEVYQRDETTWWPLVTTPCTGGVWTATSARFTSGMTVSSLLTVISPTHTSPFSPVVTLP